VHFADPMPPKQKALERQTQLEEQRLQKSLADKEKQDAEEWAVGAKDK
jgi:hypothetical protein